MLGPPNDVTPETADRPDDEALFPELLIQLLSIDEQNAKAGLVLLDRYGVISVIEVMNHLFSELTEAVTRLASESTERSPFVLNDDGSLDFRNDARMRVYLALSAPQQFYMATSNLLRGHVSDVFPHVRRAVEGAGIAYLSLTEPDIGDLFVANDRAAFRTRTRTDRILRRDDPLTNELWMSNDFANRQIHNNIESFASRMRHSAPDGAFRIDIQYHELDADSLSHYMNACIWMLRVAERVARALAASFSLPADDVWYSMLTYYRQLVDGLYADHAELLQSAFINDPVASPESDA